MPQLLRAIAAGVVLLWGAVPEAAPAAEVVGESAFGSPRLGFTADAGEKNRLIVTSSGPTVTLTDEGAVINLHPSAPCTQRSQHQVTCEAPLNLRIALGDANDLARVRDKLSGGAGLDGGPGNDALVAAPSGSSITGGDGDDRLYGGAGGDILRGLAGDDRIDGGAELDDLRGGTGRDRLRGGAGDDYLEGGGGRDDLGGGRGRDGVTYAGRRRAVFVTLDGRRNDGGRGERDVVRADVEDVSIGSGTVVGDSKANELSSALRGTLIGLGGADVLYAPSERGTLIGGAGRDSLVGMGALFGGPGNDRLRASGPVAFGGTGADTVIASGPGRFYGGPGDDRVIKGRGAPAAHLFGGTGNDMIDSRDTTCEEWADSLECAETASSSSKDHVSCGPGSDKSIAGAIDIIWRDCERIRRER